MLILSIDNDVSQVLLSEDEIDLLTTDIAAKISEKYQSGNLLLICILKGSFMFFSDIVRKITVPCTLDFMQVSSYGSSAVSSENLEILKDISNDAVDMEVLLVDDILDTGFTMFKLREYFINRKNAASVSVCTLLDKPARRIYDINPDYAAAEIPDEFVVGYGLDYDEHYRNLPYIGVLKREIYEKDN